MAALAFECQHGIDHMFEHARAGKAAVLGDMAHQYQRGAAFLGETDQLLRRCPHLADCARRAVDQVRMHRLYRIDHQHVGGRAAAEGGQYIAHRCRRRQHHRRIGIAQPPGAQPHLTRSFLARDISNRFAAERQFRRDLQQQGRFADPRIAANQARRSRHQPAAQRRIEFGDAADQSLRQALRP